MLLRPISAFMASVLISTSSMAYFDSDSLRQWDDEDLNAKLPTLAKKVVYAESEQERDYNLFKSALIEAEVFRRGSNSTFTQPGRDTRTPGDFVNDGVYSYLIKKFQPAANDEDLNLKMQAFEVLFPEEKYRTLAGIEVFAGILGINPRTKPLQPAVLTSSNPLNDESLIEEDVYVPQKPIILNINGIPYWALQDYGLTELEVIKKAGGNPQVDIQTESEIPQWALLQYIRGEGDVYTGSRINPPLPMPEAITSPSDDELETVKTEVLEAAPNSDLAAEEVQEAVQETSSIPDASQAAQELAQPPKTTRLTIVRRPKGSGKRRAPTSTQTLKDTKKQLETVAVELEETPQETATPVTSSGRPLVGGINPLGGARFNPLQALGTLKRTSQGKDLGAAADRK